MDTKTLAATIRTVCRIGTRTPGGPDHLLLRLSICKWSVQDLCGEHAWAIDQAAYALRWWQTTGRIPTDAELVLRGMSAYRAAELIAEAALAYTCVNAAVETYRVRLTGRKVAA